MSNFAEQKCIPCEEGVASLSHDEVACLLPNIPSWKTDDKKIWRDFTFKNFSQAIKFVNRIADIAEQEGHHPDMLIHAYRRVRVELMTHAADGLTENDIIMAAKIDKCG